MKQSARTHEISRKLGDDSGARKLAAEVTDAVRETFYSDSQARDEGGKWTSGGLAERSRSLEARVAEKLKT